MKTQEIIYTDAEFQEAENIVNANVIKNEITMFYLTLGQSGGSKNVRFVLYSLRLKTLSVHAGNPFSFCCVLADNLIEAAHKAKQYCGNTQIVIDFNKQNAIAAYSKWTPDVIRFGKNAGMKLSEVDNKYLLWIAKGCTIYNDEYKCWEQKNFGGDVLQSEAQKLCIEFNLGQIKDGKFYDNEYLKKLSDRESNKPIEAHYFAEKQKVTLELELVGIFGYESAFGYISIYKFKDNDNRCFTYKGSSSLKVSLTEQQDPDTCSRYVQVGDVLQLSGTIKHGNYKEIDSTFLQRIKINKKL